MVDTMDTRAEISMVTHGPHRLLKNFFFFFQMTLISLILFAASFCKYCTRQLSRILNTA